MNESEFSYLASITSKELLADEEKIKALDKALNLLGLGGVDCYACPSKIAGAHEKFKSILKRKSINQIIMAKSKYLFKENKSYRPYGGNTTYSNSNPMPEESVETLKEEYPKLFDRLFIEVDEVEETKDGEAKKKKNSSLSKDAKLRALRVEHKSLTGKDAAKSWDIEKLTETNEALKAKALGLAKEAPSVTPKEEAEAEAEAEEEAEELEEAAKEEEAEAEEAQDEADAKAKEAEEAQAKADAEKAEADKAKAKADAAKKSSK